MVKNFPKGQIPLSDFLNTKLRAGRVSRVCTLTPNFTVLTLKMWVYTAKIAEICNFWYKFAQKGYTPLSDLKKIKLGEGISSPYPQAKFHQCHFKMWAYPKIAETGNFWYKFAQKRYTPLSDFYKIWLGGGRPRFAPLCQIVSLSVKKCGSTAPKIAKIGIFCINLPKRGIPP